MWLSYDCHVMLACREEEAIKLDGLSVSEMKQLRDQAEKFAFQAEVNRMMKLIINSLYRNKEVRRGRGQWAWSVGIRLMRFLVRSVN